MLSTNEYNKLLHDLKRMATVIKIVVAEDNNEKRKVLGSLLIDEADRLASDIEELKD